VLAEGALPSAESPAGNELEQATGAEATCFDIPKSFGPNAPVEKVVLNDKCELKVPTGPYAIAFERSNPPAVGSDADKATCITQAGVRRCLTVLDPPDPADPFGAYTVKDGTATFAPAFCAALKAGTAVGGTIPKGLYLTTARAKDAPVCAPWSSVQNDANPYKDFTDAGTGTVDATIPDATLDATVPDATPDAGTITVSGNVRFLTGGTVGLTIGGQVISRSTVGRFNVTLPAGKRWDATVTTQPPLGGAPTGQFCSVVNGTGDGTASVQNLEVRCVVAKTFYGDPTNDQVSSIGNMSFAVIPSMPAQAFTLTEPSKVLIAYQIPTVSGGTAAETANFVVRITPAAAGGVPFDTAFSQRKMLKNNYGAPIGGVGVTENPLPAGDYTATLLWKSVGGGEIKLFKTATNVAAPVPLPPSLTYVALGSVGSYDGAQDFRIQPKAAEIPYTLEDLGSAVPEQSPFLFFGSGVAMQTSSVSKFTMTATAGQELLVALSGANTTPNIALGNTGDVVRSTSFLTLQPSRAGANFNVLFTNTGGQLPLIDAPSFAFGGLRLAPMAKIARKNEGQAVTAVGQAAISTITQLDLPNVSEGASVLVSGTIESATCTGNSGYGAGHTMLDLLQGNAVLAPLQRNFFMTDHEQPHTFVAVVPKAANIDFAVQLALQSQDLTGSCKTVGFSSLSAWALE
jgi:hypothetical protein